MSNRRLSRVAAGCALVAAALLPACVHQVVGSTTANGAAPSVAPQLAVETFLRAANCVSSERCATKPQDLETMCRLFGTKDGSILLVDPRDQVEKRMYALASLLQSEDYQVVGQNIVPGRVGQALELVVRLTQSEKQFMVPVTVVHDRSGNWLIEKIDRGPLTQRP